MRWNWQQPDWPDFRWDEKTIEKVEAAFFAERGNSGWVGKTS
jgi:Fic family protein